MAAIHVTGWKVVCTETGKDGKQHERALSRQYTVKEAAEKMADLYRAQGVADVYVKEQRHVEGPRPKRLVRPLQTEIKP